LFPGDAENAGVEKSGVDSMGGKCRSDNEWKAVTKRKVGPILRYQRLEQSMIGYCDNYCKDTKAVPE